MYISFGPNISKRMRRVQTHAIKRNTPPVKISTTEGISRCNVVPPLFFIAYPYEVPAFAGVS
jgi:hypothetical protein